MNKEMEQSLHQMMACLLEEMKAGQAELLQKRSLTKQK
jgi:hypothetical protein